MLGHRGIGIQRMYRACTYICAYISHPLDYSMICDEYTCALISGRQSSILSLTAAPVPVLCVLIGDSGGLEACDVYCVLSVQVFRSALCSALYLSITVFLSCLYSSNVLL